MDKPVIELCHCGKPLHYASPRTEAFVRDYIKKHGPTMPVHTGGKTYLVQCHYLALHGIKAVELPNLGFERIEEEQSKGSVPCADIEALDQPEVVIRHLSDDPICPRISMGGRPDIGYYFTFRGDPESIVVMLAACWTALKIEMKNGAIKVDKE